MSAANIKTYPNQKTIIVRHALRDRNHLYATFSIEAMEKAMMELSGNAFKIWSYIGKNQDGFTLALSSTDICDIKKMMSRPTYNTCVQELINHGYLEQVEGKKTIFYFYENPDKKYLPKAETKEEKTFESLPVSNNEKVPDYSYDVGGEYLEMLLHVDDKPQEKEIEQMENSDKLPWE